MVIHVTKPVIAAATAVSIFLLIAASHAQADPPESEVKVIVVDQNGARIADSAVDFQSNSKTIFLHTGADGTVTVTLPSDQYSVTVNARGFLKNNVLDFQVVAPKPAELRVVLQVGDCGNNSCICMYQCGDPVRLVEPTTADLPIVIPPEPAHELSSPLVTKRPTTKKVRSWQCLYLWRCSAS